MEGEKERWRVKTNLKEKNPVVINRSQNPGKVLQLRIVESPFTFLYFSFTSQIYLSLCSMFTTELHSVVKSHSANEVAKETNQHEEKNRNKAPS
jgi:hypothetical protein